LAAGLCQDPLGELTVLPDPLAGLREPASKGEEGSGGREKRWEGRKGWEEEGKKGE